MPAYDFKSTDGVVREFIVPGGTVHFESDGKTWNRASAVHAVAVVGLSSGSHSDDVRRGYYAQELKQGSNFRSKFTKNQIKKAWNI
tara:strand:- start:819 stop:1076 length:258 start_codon:yes stop_codon:yes gene_type:complete